VVARRGGLSRVLDVLVVGAGPAGLTTALQAHAHGASVAVVDRRQDAFRPSRAMIVHPRTMESLRPLGVGDAILARGERAFSADLHLGSRTVSVDLGRLALPGTAYPHLTMVRQTDVEEVLRRAVEQAGVPVEWGAELVDLEQDPDVVRCVVRSRRGPRTVESRYVAGCDGPDSLVRRLCGIGWRGGPYREEVVLADVEIEGLAPGRLHVVAATEGLLFLFARGERATWRLLSTRPRREDGEPYGQTGTRVPDAEVEALVAASGLGGRVTDVAWSSAVGLQHRLADSFADRRVFLVGDAAHAHSPAAAQGMNTGILDAVNLGWKLGFAVARPGGDVTALLGSYEHERRPVARQVLALTHAVFFAEASTSPAPKLLRGHVLPLVAPLVPCVVRQRWLLAQVVKVLSQSWVRYRRSALSVDGSPAPAAWPHAGDRLPDRDVLCEGRVRRLHELTASPGVHVLLERDAPSVRRSASDHVTVHRLEAMSGRGLVAVRPDGYVGCRGTDPEALESWLDLVGRP
jgi:2-polyprenyl-6-methoxyphenol hydroxylase-like FAD-dependent oxidoreductase